MNSFIENQACLCSSAAYIKTLYDVAYILYRARRCSDGAVDVPPVAAFFSRRPLYTRSRYRAARVFPLQVLARNLPAIIEIEAFNGILYERGTGELVRKMAITFRVFLI